MRKIVLAVLCLLAGAQLALQTKAQSGAVTSQGGAGHAQKPDCVILKRMGPADEVTSHLYSFGIRGKQFQYVEGKLPQGVSFHGRLTDHDVRTLQQHGAEIQILESHYTAEDLKQAREQCESTTEGAPLNQTSAAPATSMHDSGQSASPSSQAPMMNNDAVVKMVKAGLSDDVIVTTINSSPGSYDTSANGLIALRQADVSNKVIEAIVAKTSGGAPAPAPTAAPNPEPTPK